MKNTQGKKEGGGSLASQICVLFVTALRIYVEPNVDVNDLLMVVVDLLAQSIAINSGG